MYGTQTYGCAPRSPRSFENDVKMYGTQTIQDSSVIRQQFENDVKMYGTQTDSSYITISLSLRMM